jgi:hypothetical protein
MCLLGAESQVWSEGWEDMPILCQHPEESLHNETRSEIRNFIACSKSMIISSRTAESAIQILIAHIETGIYRQSKRCEK